MITTLVVKHISEEDSLISLCTCNHTCLTSNQVKNIIFKRARASTWGVPCMRCSLETQNDYTSDSVWLGLGHELNVCLVNLFVDYNLWVLYKCGQKLWVLENVWREVMFDLLTTFKSFANHALSDTCAYIYVLSSFILPFLGYFFASLNFLI